MKQLLLCAWIFAVLSACNPTPEPPPTPVGKVITIGYYAPTMYFNELIGEDFFDAFKEAHPDVQVVVKPIERLTHFGEREGDFDGYMKMVAEYASQADVLMIDEQWLSPETTLAQYYLDLKPLTESDPTLDPSDFFPTLWESYQWDGGLWALPAAADLDILHYNPAAFDALAIPYPTEQWTYGDVIRVGQQLTQRDANDQLLVNGFTDFSESGLVWPSLFAQRDDSGLLPIDSIEWLTFLEKFATLQEAGFFEFGSEQTSGFDYPLQFSRLSSIYWQPEPNQPNLDQVLLPGGVSIPRVIGYVVSAGTEQPEIAYQLAAYLTERVDEMQGLGRSIPARQSVLADYDQAYAHHSPEAAAEVDAAVTAAIPSGQLYDLRYMAHAIYRVTFEGADPAAALAEVQTAARENREAAATEYRQTRLAVATPQPTAALQPGEVALTFNYVPWGATLESTRMQSLADQFVAQDPQVGALTIATETGPSVDDYLNDFDCAYLPFNPIGFVSFDRLYNLKPLLEADTTFTYDQLPQTLLREISVLDGIYAYPMALQPRVIWYDPARLTDAGLTPPTDRWTIQEFEQITTALQGDTAAFVVREAGSHAWLMLIMAHGGLPLDYSTTPPTVRAIQTVLDRAKAKVFSYSALESQAGFPLFANEPLYSEPLRGIGISPLAYMLFPTGTQSAPFAFTMSAGVVNAAGFAPEACYRWLRFLSVQPEALDGLPLTDLASPYDPFRPLLDQAFPLPTQFVTDDRVYVELFNIAMDRYVLEDVSLITALNQAATDASTYRDCLDPAPEDTRAWVETRNRCLETHLPDLSIRFVP
ncbi:MAG: extracellular solute-binding protein [Anaerolineae bacterium]|nr:extracellular solute-binding protein [Anaerolineae bacterium]